MGDARLHPVHWPRRRRPHVHYRDLDVDAKTNVAGYGTLGGEIGFGLIGLRIEGRDYVSQFKPFDGGDSKTRNDVTVAAGLTLRF